MEKKLFHEKDYNLKREGFLLMAKNGDPRRPEDRAIRAVFYSDKKIARDDKGHVVVYEGDKMNIFERGQVDILPRSKYLASLGAYAWAVNRSENAPLFDRMMSKILGLAGKTPSYYAQQAHMEEHKAGIGDTKPDVEAIVLFIQLPR